MYDRSIWSVACLAAALVFLGCGADDRGVRGGTARTNNNAGGDQQQESGRADSDRYTQDRVEQHHEPSSSNPIIIRSAGGRAILTIPPRGLLQEETFTIEAVPAATLAGSDNVIDGIYDFRPEGFEFEKDVTVVLPLNGLDLSANELELVRWEDGWAAVADVDLAKRGGTDGITATGLRTLGTFGLRAPGGLDSSEAAEGEGEGGSVLDGECPGPTTDFSIGWDVDNRLPGIRVKNSDNQGVSLFDLCGNKAVLVVASAFW